MLPMRTILHPTDFSERSRHALQVAAALARDHGARLLLLHIAELPAAAYGEAVVMLDRAAYASEVQVQLDRLPVPLPPERVERRLALAPSPAPEIVCVAEETPCDLIVMGTHGRTGLRRALLGSVAEQVMRRAPCPVLTVKVPFPAAQAEEAAASPAEAAPV
jgi:nucleotide-binding universal stress UspA family protein